MIVTDSASRQGTPCTVGRSVDNKPDATARNDRSFARACLDVHASTAPSPCHCPPSMVVLASPRGDRTDINATLLDLDVLDDALVFEITGQNVMAFHALRGLR